LQDASLIADQPTGPEESKSIPVTVCIFKARNSQCIKLSEYFFSRTFIPPPTGRRKPSL